MKKFGVIMSLMLVLSVLCALPVLAADALAGANPVGEALAGLLRGDVWPIIGALVSGLLSLLLNKIRIKTGLQISGERQEQLDRLARQAVAMAEEKAAALIKGNVTTITGKTKLDLAIAHIIAMTPAVSVEQADALVHAALAKIPGVGATGTQAL